MNTNCEIINIDIYANTYAYRYARYVNVFIVAISKSGAAVFLNCLRQIQQSIKSSFWASSIWVFYRRTVHTMSTPRQPWRRTQTNQNLNYIAYYTRRMFPQNKYYASQHSHRCAGEWNPTSTPGVSNHVKLNSPSRCPIPTRDTPGDQSPEIKLKTTSSDANSSFYLPCQQTQTPHLSNVITGEPFFFSKAQNYTSINTSIPDRRQRGQYCDKNNHLRQIIAITHSRFSCKMLDLISRTR